MKVPRSQNALGDNAVRDPNDFPTDDSLVAALRRQDSSAYEAFIRRFGGRMHAAARRYFHDQQDCHDVVQDAFISVFQSIDRFAGNSKFGTWLHRIVINACLMKLRARSRRAEISIEQLLPQFDASGHDRQPARRWKSCVEEELRREENRALVRQYIEMLPTDYREVLLLRDIEEFSTAETAVALKISPGSVKTRLHRARQALRTLLEPHFSK